METEGNKEEVRRLYLEGFNENMPDVVDEVVADEFVFHVPSFGVELRDAEAIQAIKDEIIEYADAGKFTRLEQIAEGESVATRYMLELRGQIFEGVTVARFGDSKKIQEYFVVADAVPEEQVRRARAHN